MSDDRELSPEQERVRRLLAQARVDEPMPDDVAERLDRVLAQLADEADDDAPSVVDLAARRRRKAATLLVAAAAVVAVGVGAGNLFGGPGLSDGGADSPAADTAAEPRAGVQDRNSADAPEATSATVGSARAPGRVRDASFADDVARLRLPLEQDGSLSSAAPPGDSAQFSAGAEGAGGFVCDAAPWGPGELMAVRYSGMPAILAFRPPAGDTQVVDLLECGTAAILRSVTLPVP